MEARNKIRQLYIVRKWTKWKRMTLKMTKKQKMDRLRMTLKMTKENKGRSKSHENNKQNKADSVREQTDRKGATLKMTKNKQEVAD